MEFNTSFSDFFKNATCAILVLDVGSIVYVNNSCLKLFGYENEELLSLHPADLSPKFQDDGEVSIIKADHMISKAIKEGANIFYWQHLKKDHTILKTQVILTHIKNNNEDFLFAIIKKLDSLDKKEEKKKNTILLIDDDTLILTTAKAILEEFDYKVITALDGDSGIEIYKKHINDIVLVILDMDMPNKSGDIVYYELKTINNNIKAIISSGYKNDKRVKDVLEHGVKAFIEKPYGISYFMNKINEVLDN